MRISASNYPINLDKIAILGCSSGGQLAALVGSTNGVQKLDGNWQWQKDNSNDARSSSDVQAIINIDGILDFTSEEARKYEDDPTKNPSSAGAWFGGRYHEKPNLWREASPLYHVNEKTPPILFINSLIPRFHIGRDEMIKKLEQFDIYYELHPIADSPHPFWFFHPWFEQTIELVTDFLDRVFKE